MKNSPVSPGSFQTLLQLVGYAGAQRAQIHRASAYSIINKLFDIAPEILIGMAIDVVVNKQTSFLGQLGFVDLMDQLIILGVLTFVIWACESFFEFLYKVEWRTLAQSIQHRLRCETYSHVQNLDLSTFEDASVGHWVSIMNDDVNQLERFLDTGANDLIQVFTTVIAVGAIFFFLSPLVALFAFLPIPIILFGAFYFQKKAAPLYAGVRKAAGKMAGRLTGNLAGISTIKSFCAEDREFQFLQKDSQAYLEANFGAIRVSSAFVPVIRIAILTGFLSTLVLGGWLCLNGDLNVGSYGVLVFLTQRLLWPLTRLAETIDLYERAMASTRRVFQLLRLPIEITSHSGAKALAAPAGELRFENVGFSYGSSKGNFQIQGIDFVASRGKTVAFVGATGSGKSTIVKLLLRFYDVKEGRITIDGTDLRDLEIPSLRSQIGIVSQDVFLFQGSVLENIRYGRPDATDEEVLKAARAAEVDEFANQLPDGFHTAIGERGQKLSGGQKQRICLARAILKNPPILVLDEATSAVDNETEAAIQRSLIQLTRDRTTLVIAHRLSTVVSADQILVIDGGTIAAAGTHAELISKEGIYRNLWTVQTGSAIQ